MVASFNKPLEIKKERKQQILPETGLRSDSEWKGFKLDLKDEQTDEDGEHKRGCAMKQRDCEMGKGWDLGGQAELNWSSARGGKIVRNIVSAGAPQTCLK